MESNDFTSDTAATDKLSKTDYAELRALFDDMLEGKMCDSAQLELLISFEKTSRYSKT